MRSVAAVLLLLTSLSTYFSSASKTLFYLAFLGMFAFYLLQRPNFELQKKILLIVPIGYLLATILSLIFNYEYVSEDAFQSLLYPFILLFVLLSGYHVLYDLKGWGAKLMISFFLINGAVALLAVLVNLKNVPLFGEITRGRYIFGTDIQSAAGLIWNVNYYSVTQLVGFWFSIFAYHYFKLDKKWILIAIFIALTTVLGSSRSVALALLISLTIYSYLRSSRSIKRLIEVGLIAFIFFFGSLYTYLATDEQLSTSLRIDRGLNSRDVLWDYAFELFAQSPIFGVFSISEIERLLVADAGMANTSVQNTFLFTLIRLGVLGVSFLLLFVLFVIVGFAKKKNKTAADFALFSCFISLMFDSMVRTYSLGGVGFCPFMMIVCGCCVMFKTTDTHLNKSII